LFTCERVYRFGKRQDDQGERPSNKPLTFAARSATVPARNVISEFYYAQYEVARTTPRATAPGNRSTTAHQHAPAYLEKSYLRPSRPAKRKMPPKPCNLVVSAVGQGRQTVHTSQGACQSQEIPPAPYTVRPPQVGPLPAATFAVVTGLRTPVIVPRPETAPFSHNLFILKV